MHSDRHVHTPYCLHGSSDALENYVKVAIEAGLDSLTFTEHAPLPMEDPLPDKDSSMRPEDVDAYLSEVRALAKKYQGSIEIHAGFELDYLEGKETETRAFLEKYPETVPHSILSVHFVQLAPEEYFCIDLTANRSRKKARKSATKRSIAFTKRQSKKLWRFRMEN